MRPQRNSYFAMALAGLLGMASVPGPSLAAETVDAKVRTPTFGEALGVSDIKIGGYIDTSYTYSGNKNVTFNNNSNNPNDIPNRVDDRQPNSFK